MLSFIMATPMTTPEQRKQKIKDHLSRSLGKFTKDSDMTMGLTNSSARKERIMNHLRLTKGN